MATPDNPATVSRSRSRAVRLLAVVGGGLVLGVLVFFGVGRWLVVEDPLAKARAIVVLSGAMPSRALEAAKLYREGYAPEVWLTHSMEPGKSLEEVFTGLLALGVLFLFDLLDLLSSCWLIGGRAGGRQEFSLGKRNAECCCAGCRRGACSMANW